MGCDIHIFAEVKTNGKWTKTGKLFKGWKEGELTDEPYCGRNYDLFAILADVRNGRGGARNVSNEEIETAIDTKQIQHYTRVEWGWTYAQSCQNFINETIPALQKLGDPENVRIVFWFDN